MKRLKISVGVKQGKIVGNAKGGNKHINGLPHCDSFPAQQAEIVGALQSYILTAERENSE